MEVLNRDQASQIARALFIRDTSGEIARFARGGSDAPTPDELYVKLAEHFVCHMVAHPEHAIRDIASSLRRLEHAADDIAKRRTSEPPLDLSPVEIVALREANNQRMGLPPGS